MGDMIEPKERHRVKHIEDLTSQILSNLDSTLAEAKSIDTFFFGTLEGTAGKEAEDKKVPAGWLELHIEMLQTIGNRIIDVRNALRNITRLTPHKE